MTVFVQRAVVLRKLCTDAASHHKGATSVEYALIVALIAMVIIGAVAVLGGHVLGLFEKAVTAPW
ncbi:MAG: Flp family type IVb pilin [Thermoleophilia bacterium]|nr:Flp family type IVb pilin [Thermoleophilia bacterium]